MVSNVLHGHAGTCTVNFTCNQHWVVHFTEVDSNHLCVSTQFEAPGAEQFEAYASRDARALESIVKVLQVHHDMGHAFLVQSVIARVELLE